MVKTSVREVREVGTFSVFCVTFCLGELCETPHFYAFFLAGAGSNHAVFQNWH